jgi:hypothetical protein
MTDSMELPCDGCGQISTPEHIARRLQRLEWSTRYRPVHIHTLLLCAASQPDEKDFLYSPHCEFRGEAGRVLEVAGISAAGKTGETALAEFQRAGFFLAPVLECAFDAESQGDASRMSLLERRLPELGRRIRRSLKPKRVALISMVLEPVAEKIAAMELGCPLIWDDGKPFGLDGSKANEAVRRLREALAARTD